MHLLCFQMHCYFLLAMLLIFIGSVNGVYTQKMSDQIPFNALFHSKKLRNGYYGQKGMFRPCKNQNTGS